MSFQSKLIQVHSTLSNFTLKYLIKNGAFKYFPVLQLFKYLKTLVLIMLSKYN